MKQSRWCFYCSLCIFVVVNVRANVHTTISSSVHAFYLSCYALLRYPHTHTQCTHREHSELLYSEQLCDRAIIVNVAVNILEKLSFFNVKTVNCSLVHSFVRSFVSYWITWKFCVRCSHFFFFFGCVSLVCSSLSHFRNRSSRRFIWHSYIWDVVCMFVSSSCHAKPNQRVSLILCPLQMISIAVVVDHKVPN